MHDQILNQSKLQELTSFIRVNSEISKVMQIESEIPIIKESNEPSESKHEKFNKMKTITINQMIQDNESLKDLEKELKNVDD